MMVEAAGEESEDLCLEAILFGHKKLKELYSLLRISAMKH